MVLRTSERWQRAIIREFDRTPLALRDWFHHAWLARRGVPVRKLGTTQKKETITAE